MPLTIASLRVTAFGGVARTSAVPPGSRPTVMTEPPATVRDVERARCPPVPVWFSFRLLLGLGSKASRSTGRVTALSQLHPGCRDPGGPPPVRRGLFAEYR